MWIIVIAAAAVILLYVLTSHLRSPRALPIVGSNAPDFSLWSQDGTRVSLKDFRGKWVVLYFYPKDMTSGCTVEARNFQRDQAEYERRNAVVLGVSLDNVESHRKFCAKDGLSFILLADTAHEVSKAYGSLVNLGMVKMSARNTFLIDPNGRIARTFAKVNPSGHSAELLTTLDKLQIHQLELQ